MSNPTTAAVKLLAGVREPCRVATTANITLSGLQTVDGVALAAADRVLVKNQTDASQNGIYTASTGNWRRASDATFSRAITKGVIVYVVSGTANGGAMFSFQTINPDIGDDDITIATFLSGDTLDEIAAAQTSSVAAVQAAGTAALSAIAADIASASADTAAAITAEMAADVAAAQASATAAAASATTAAGYAAFITREKFRATGQAQSVAASSGVVAQYAVEMYDTGNRYDTSTYRVTPAAGYYKLTARQRFSSVEVDISYTISIRKNGGTVAESSHVAATGGGSVQMQVEWDGACNGTDFFDVQVDHGSSGAKSLSTAERYGSFSGVQI